MPRPVPRGANRKPGPERRRKSRATAARTAPARHSVVYPSTSVPSTDSPGPDASFDWRRKGLRFHALGHFLRTTFGTAVRKIAVDAGLGCPNRDGTLGSGGCLFCNPASFSAARRAGAGSLDEQIASAMARARDSGQAARWIVYFQPGTNTYGRLDRLAALFEAALAHAGVVGLAVGTRPDCLGEDVLDLLEAVSRRTWLLVELGLQTIDDELLGWLRRGHDYAAFAHAVERAHRRGLRLGAHLIFGLPGETTDRLHATADRLAGLGVETVKLHHLHVVRGTPLERLWADGALRLPSLDQYVGWVADFLERLPGRCVVDRLSGDAPPEWLVAPDWGADRQRVRRAVLAELERRDTWQGRLVD